MSTDVDRARKKKAGGTRSRGACNTCRIRRVKCDEEKPGCMRCRKFGRVCDGYEIKKIRTPPSAPIVGKPVTPTRYLLPISLAPIKYPSQVPITISFQDERQERYFRLFHDETSGELSGGLASELWSRLVLQACHEEPCILHCAVALSALSKAFKSKSSKVLHHTAEFHHQYALREYGKALKGVQEVISRGSNTLRTVLIAALLIFCFENFHGDVRLALTNVQSAVALMRDWLASSIDFSPPVRASPTPSIIDDEIVIAFTRLDVHLMSWVDTPHPTRGSILRYASPAIRPIPIVFETFQEAVESWEHIVNRIFQFLCTVPDIKRRCDQSPYNDVFDENGNQYSESPAAAELRIWTDAFTPLFFKARSQTDSPEFVVALLIRIHVLTLEMSLRSAFFHQTDDHMYAVFLPEYCEIVALCRDVAQHPGFVKSFVFDSGIVPSLFLVLTKCPDLAVRQEALSVLKMAGPRREGVWDSSMVISIGEDLMKGQGQDDDSKVEDRVAVHLKCLSTTFQLPGRRGVEEQDIIPMLNYFCDYSARQHLDGKREGLV